MNQAIVGMTKTMWEAEYAQGQWDYVRRLDELVRYSAIVGYCAYFAPRGTILDVGCGEGVLQQRLCPLQYSHYLGIDVCAEAIRRASLHQDAQTSFVCTEARTFIPDMRFDVIVFNECLYYFADALGLLCRYESFLNQGGIFIVSMYLTDATIGLGKAVNHAYSVEDQVTIQNRSGKAWMIQVLRATVY